MYAQRKVVSIYIYKAEKLSVCLSVRHADNLPGTANINITTAKHPKPVIFLLQVCHRE